MLRCSIRYFTDDAVIGGKRDLVEFEGSAERNRLNGEDGMILGRTSGLPAGRGAVIQIAQRNRRRPRSSMDRTRVS